MSTINVRSYKGPVRPDGTPIELPQKVLKLTKKSNMRHKLSLINISEPTRRS